MAEEAGKVNRYTCSGCGWQAVTVNRDEGTTPFSITCGGPEDCTRKSKGKLAATSEFYRVDQALKPTHEWFRPKSAGERKKIVDEATAEHVRMGGLLLRSLETKAVVE